MKKLRIAMIRLGDIAQKAYLPILAADSRITPILCTRDQQVLKRLSGQYRINECYENIEQLIQGQPDAVMVHTATDSHFEIARKILKAGIPVFIDKPLSTDIQECEQLLNIAETTGTALYVGFNRRFAPKIAQLLTQSSLQVRWQKNRVSLPATATDFIFNDFIHVVDGLCFLAGNDVGKLSNLQVFGQYQQQ